MSRDIDFDALAALLRSHNSSVTFEADPVTDDLSITARKNLGDRGHVATKIVAPDEAAAAIPVILRIVSLLANKAREAEIESDPRWSLDPT